MRQYIEEIRKSLEQKCYISALALALIIPDIGGSIEFPEYRRKDKKDKKGREVRDIKAQYSAWFEKWVQPPYVALKNSLDDNLIDQKNYFTGEMCYSLRCQFLHEGNSNIRPYGRESGENGVKVEYVFELSINGGEAYGKITEESNEYIEMIRYMVRINVEELCERICKGAEEFCQDRKQDEFRNHVLNIIDFSVSPRPFQVLCKRKKLI